MPAAVRRLTHMHLVKQALLAAAVCVVAGSDAHAGAPRTAVVVELFSSEGCAACQPADELLHDLDHDQRVANAEIVALEFHVDDAMSQPAFGARQRMHAWFDLHSTRTYTPELVVDGREEIAPSAAGAQLVIGAAARRPHVAVTLARAGDVVTIETGAAPAPEGVTHAMLAITERGVRTSVEHGPVVRSLRYIGDLGAPNAAGVTLSARMTQPRAAGRSIVVFVEARDSLHVLGAAAID